LTFPTLLVYTYTMLSALFNAQSIAVSGASADLINGGHAVFCDLFQYGHGEKLVPIIPSSPETLRLKTFFTATSACNPARSAL
jgi:hypothetical protein